MAVSSPYAVFRATDLDWPAVVPHAAAWPRRVCTPQTIANTPQKLPCAAERLVATGRWARLIQGELFEFSAGSPVPRSDVPVTPIDVDC